MCSSVRSLLERCSAWSASVLEDPATPAAVAWLLGLEGWKVALGVGAILAILFGTKVTTQQCKHGHIAQARAATASGRPAVAHSRSLKYGRGTKYTE